MAAPDEDLLAYYARCYRPGLADLSSSSPPTPVLECAPAASLEYVPPRGAPELRAAIAARYTGVSPGDVVLSAGASEALAALSLALVRPGRPVALVPGTYPSFVEAARSLRGSLAWGSRVPRGATAALTCNPTTPAGQVADLPSFIRAARRAGAVPIVDEVYRELSHGERLPAAVELDEAAVSIAGLSKPLGAGGLRIGWVATHDQALLGRLDRQLQLLSGGPAAPSVAVALGLLPALDKAIASTLAAVWGNAPKVYAVLARQGWGFTRPRAGLTLEAWPPYPLPPWAEARALAAGFFVVPCSVYGAPGAFRFSLLAPPGALARGLRALESAALRRSA